MTDTTNILPVAESLSFFLKVIIYRNDLCIEINKPITIHLGQRSRILIPIYYCFVFNSTFSLVCTPKINTNIDLIVIAGKFKRRLYLDGFVGALTLSSIIIVHAENNQDWILLHQKSTLGRWIRVRNLEWDEIHLLVPKSKA